MDKKLKMMRFWLFGTFIIVFAAATIYVGMFTGAAIFSDWHYWVSMGVAAALCVAAFFVYKSIVSKEE